MKPNEPFCTSRWRKIKRDIGGEPPCQSVSRQKQSLILLTLNGVRLRSASQQPSTVGHISSAKQPDRCLPNMQYLRMLTTGRQKPGPAAAVLSGWLHLLCSQTILNYTCELLRRPADF
jgi:hypothetical protein